MPTLSKDLRNQLARVSLDARETAERACRAALENLAVHEKDYRGHMTAEQRLLRNKLRARGRALGDTRDERSGTQEIRHLAEAAAYEHWHRLLFTRFLADNHLLHTDGENGSVPVSLQECEELAPELQARDGFDLACRFAAKTLPGVFRSDDPSLLLRLALNDEVELRQLLDSLPHEVFTATDSLGWTYQFWQEKRKREINETNKKRGADEIPAVTQLFTEDYMVEFLLHNSLGAWWAGKLGPIRAANEAEARAKAALPVKDGLGIIWTYLRFVQDDTTKTWSPAAGTFSGWPRQAKLIKFLDPCMGSGHFVVFALPLLARMRMEEEGLSAASAIHATLCDNMSGLELDERCAQIAAFNLALTAWKLGGYQPLPPLHLACSGLAPHAAEIDWVALANEDDRLKRGMARLHALFKDAPVLGSLINPRAGGDLVEADFHELQPLLEMALAQETKDYTAHEMAVTACGLAKAAEILAGQFTLVATNVPFLGRRKQDEVLMDYCERTYPDGKKDLATCFIERCLAFCEDGCSTSLLAPQNWLFLGTYEALRKKLLRSVGWNFVCRMGAKSFQTPMYDFGVAMHTFTAENPSRNSSLVGFDVGALPSPTDKASALFTCPMAVVNQLDQLENPDSAIIFEEVSKLPLLSKFADSHQGAHTFDINCFRQCFWEMNACLELWNLHSSSPSGLADYSGCHYVSYKRDENNAFGKIIKQTKSVMWRNGQHAWGKNGVACAWMGKLPVSLYIGQVFDNSVAVIIPKNQAHLLPIYCFFSSPTYLQEIRKINQKTQVADSTLVKVPFDLAHWQKVAAEKYPHGLPKPFSSDPTQWLFNGHPAGADQPLHVAVARLLGYQWPRQTGSSFPDCPVLGPDGLEKLADDDGIVCLQPLNREQPAAHRLRELLTKALGKFEERALIAATGSDKTNFEDWLRDDFFEQHCDLFHQRPFIWHIWDGRKDGFHALVNYHKLDHDTLQKLTYSYLGDWIRHQNEDAKAEKPGAEARLGAAQGLQAELDRILQGEAPHDIFVRWKPLAKQAIGWNPDLNDGVRLNIRPFMSAADVGKRGAGVLRSVPLAIKDKDRGTEPQRDKAEYPWFWSETEPGTDPKPGKAFTGLRWNDVHLTLQIKRAARK